MEWRRGAEGRRGRASAHAVRSAVLIAGFAFSATTAFAAPGDLDPTFGRGGVVTTNFGWGRHNTSARTLLRQHDGKLVGGGSGLNGSHAFGVVPYLAEQVHAA